MTRNLLAAALLSLALPAFADDDPADDEPTAEASANQSDASGVGAKTKYSAPSKAAATEEEDAPISEPATSGGRGSAVKSGAFEPVRRGKLQSASGSGGGAAGAGGGALPKEIQGTKFEISESLKAMPRHVGAHGAASVRQEKQGHAVGFNSGPASDPEHVRGGVCGVGETPGVPRDDDGCWWYTWISATPGGDPAGGIECTAFKLLPRIASVNWASITAPGLKAHACQLTPGKKYYCNFTATAAGGKPFPKECGGAVSSPISFYD